MLTQHVKVFVQSKSTLKKLFLKCRINNLRRFCKRDIALRMILKQKYYSTENGVRDVYIEN